MHRPLPMAATAPGRQSSRPCLELADVVRGYGQQFVRTYPSTAEQRRVLRAIRACRSAELGGHVELCRRQGCEFERIAYNSCRNRHCPKCQGKERARWMDAECAMLLPVPYFHVVFTLPHELNPLIRANPRRLYALLFRVAARTLRRFALDPQYLGAEPAITMVLHTWGQTLTEHAHVHCVVSGGGLSLDGRHWIAARRRSRQRRRRRRRPFLFPVQALCEVFGAKYLAALRRQRRLGGLRYPGEAAPLAHDAAWKSLLDTLWSKPWVVYAKQPFGGPERVLKYLSRYTHRVAISNHRLRHVGDGVVRFTYRDSAHHNRTRQMELPGVEFLRRFVQHVLPTGFMRIRHYGITANARRREKLARCRELLGPGADPVSPGGSDKIDTLGAGTETDDGRDRTSSRCPRCGAPLHCGRIIPPVPASDDTS